MNKKHGAAGLIPAVDEEENFSLVWEDTMFNWLVALKEAAVAVHRDESGQDLIEYALIAALIAVAAIIGMKAVATAINTAFLTVGNTLDNAM